MTKTERLLANLTAERAEAREAASSAIERAEDGKSNSTGIRQHLALAARLTAQIDELTAITS